MTPSRASSSPEVWTATDLAGDPHEVADKADRVQRMFSAIAPKYDLNNRLHSFGRDQAWRRRLVRLCRVQPTDDVLDVACGTGDLTEAFARARPRSIVGGDFTEPMLDIARAKATQRQRPNGEPTPQYRHTDAMALPFDDDSFDIVSIAFGIRNVAEPARALSEFRRVLRPGGRCAILEFDQPRNRVIRWFNNVYCQRIMPITASLIARDRSGAYKYLPKSVDTFMDGATMRAAMETAGFGDVASHPMTFGVCAAHIGIR